MRIAGDIRRDIAHGKYPAGTALPTIGVLANSYACNRVTVTKAIALLAREHLVIRFPGMGWYSA
jgi:DNA-binding GntR family transcriptional regulator